MRFAPEALIMCFSIRGSAPDPLQSRTQMARNGRPCPISAAKTNRPHNLAMLAQAFEDIFVVIDEKAADHLRHIQ